VGVRVVAENAPSPPIYGVVFSIAGNDVPSGNVVIESKVGMIETGLCAWQAARIIQNRRGIMKRNRCIKL
jgi:hypothetical protein